MAKSIAQADALLFGQVTYELMEAGSRPFARTIDATNKYVVSSTLDRVDWNAEIMVVTQILAPVVLLC